MNGTPEIFNTNQGSQFTSTDFIKVLAAREIRISMDGNPVSIFAKIPYRFTVSSVCKASCEGDRVRVHHAIVSHCD